MQPECFEDVFYTVLLYLKNKNHFVFYGILLNIFETVT